MTTFLRIFFLFNLLSCHTYWLNAQNDILKNQEIFGEFMDRKGNEYRTASGKPGPKYWQNEAHYQLDAELDPTTHTITGHVTIEYINNSPEELEFIWLHLEQNRFKDDSRGTLTTPYTGDRYASDTEGGFRISNVSLRSGRKIIRSDYHITDTRMQVFFEQPVSAFGGGATISMDFSFKIPERGMDRMGRLEVEDGTVYAIAQWYPRVAVFDDIQGWNARPYLGAGEFYLEYGDFDCRFTVPYDYIVAGSGELVNRKEVLSKTLLQRWEEAEKSNHPVFLIRENEIKNYDLTRPQSSGTLTWHYQVKNARDIAIGASNAFIWDAARMNLAGGKSGLAQSLYPKESAGENAWGRSTEYTKASIEFYDQNYYPYPLPTAINVACQVGGMEYPGVSFCHYTAKQGSLWFVTDHEFGHNWFPMLVGSNERKHVWLDEGLNTYMNHYSTKAFNNGEYTSTLDQSRRFIGWLTRDSREPVFTYPDITNLNNLAMTGYRKPGIGFILLREYILERDLFDRALRIYIDRWKYKHPQPADFFNTIDNVTGEDLNWFWKGWFYGTGNIDLKVDNVRQTESGYLITLGNKGEVPMPVLMEITYEDGSSERVKLPVEIWFRGPEWTYFLRSSKQIVSVEIDPDKILPDVNGSNDAWPPGFYD